MLYCQPFFEYTLIQLDSVQVDVGNENIRRFIGQLNHVIRVRSSEFFHCSVGGDFGEEWQECQFAYAGTMYADGNCCSVDRCWLLLLDKVMEMAFTH